MLIIGLFRYQLKAQWKINIDGKLYMIQVVNEFENLE